MRDHFISVDEILAMEGVKYQTLYSWLREDGAPERLKVGRKIYFNRALALAWLAARLRG